MEKCADPVKHHIGQHIAFVPDINTKDQARDVFFAAHIPDNLKPGVCIAVSDMGRLSSGYMRQKPSFN